MKSYLSNPATIPQPTSQLKEGDNYERDDSKF